MDFDAILATLRGGVVDLAKNTVTDFVDEAREDADAFLNSSRDDLQRWLGLMADGKLTAFELQFLVKMRADLAEMHALTAMGLAKTRVERFRTGLISLVVRTMSTAV